MVSGLQGIERAEKLDMMSIFMARCLLVLTYEYYARIVTAQIKYS